jgi:hypothetical protein
MPAEIPSKDGYATLTFDASRTDTLLPETLIEDMDVAGETFIEMGRYERVTGMIKVIDNSISNGKAHVKLQQSHDGAAWFDLTSELIEGDDDDEMVKMDAADIAGDYLRCYVQRIASFAGSITLSVTAFCN